LIKIEENKMQIKKIYSKVNPDKLLHMIIKKDDCLEGNKRVDIIPEENFIQCSYLKLEKGKTFKPHKHIFKERHYDKKIAQESWVVISGKVMCILYDLNDNVLTKETLEPGEASFTLEGGHNYLILEEDTIVYEYKTGPYEGQALDKVFIENT